LYPNTIQFSKFLFTLLVRYCAHSRSPQCYTLVRTQNYKLDQHNNSHYFFLPNKLTEPPSRINNNNINNNNMPPPPPPAEFICPLTKEVMHDPVMSRYGDSFERNAILAWLDEGNHFCPVTGKPLRPSCLVSNKNLEWKIRCWFHEHGREAPPKHEDHDDDDDEEEDDEDEDEPEFLHHFAGFVTVPPTRFLCPLTKKLMHNPVMTKDGKHYECTAILQYLNEHQDTCPENGTPLKPHNLIPDHHLQREIHTWLQNYSAEDDEPLPPLEPGNVDGLPHPHPPHDYHHLFDPTNHCPTSPGTLVGARGDPVIVHLRLEHVERERKENGHCEKDDILDPFCSSSVIDQQHDTLESLGHVF
jgi:U-box domain